jgi:hypothetical protein
MAKSVTVNFEDGTSHTYDNVPDDVTNDLVQDRAHGEFPDKVVAGFDHGEVGGGPAAPMPAPTPEIGMGEKVLGAAQTAGQMAIEHPAVAGSVVGLYKANQLGNRYVEAKKIAAEAERLQAETAARTAADHQTLQREKIAERVARTATPMPETPRILGANGAPMTPAAPGSIPTPTAAPMTAPVSAPVAPPATPAQQGSTFLQRMAQMVDTVSPEVKAVGQTVAKYAAPVLQHPITRAVTGPIGVGVQLATHSGGLNTNEDAEMIKNHARNLEYARKMGWIK